MALWGGETGPEVTWGFRKDLAVGQVCDVVAEIVSHTDGAVLATLVPGGEKAKFLGQLVIPGDCTSLGVFDATLLGPFSNPLLHDRPPRRCGVPSPLHQV